MNEPISVSIPVDHLRRVHVVEARHAPEAATATLGELVEAVAEFSDSEQEVVATVMHMLRSGRVRLRGTYAEPPAAKLCG